MNTTKALGDRGEAAAAQYLRQRGFALLASQWRCRYGELDLVARDRDGTICFVEVKLRSGSFAGLPREAVDRRKQERLRAAAACYLSQHDLDAPARFDVAEGLYGWGSPPPPAGIFGKCVLKNSQKERAT